MTAPATAKTTKQVTKKLDTAQVEDVVMRDTPTDEEIKANKPTPKNLDKHVKVRTVSGGTMYDPEHEQWVEGKLTLATHSDWIDRQAKAGKLIIEK